MDDRKQAVWQGLFFNCQTSDNTGDCKLVMRAGKDVSGGLWDARVTEEAYCTVAVVQCNAAP